MKRIGILTSGGDSPGMNAAIRAAVRCGIDKDMEVFAIYRGYEGLIEGEIKQFDRRSVGDILQRGGTILRTARSARFTTEEGMKKAASVLDTFGIEDLIVIGGNGSLTGASMLSEKFGIRVMGLPGTIDNDLGYTDYTIGFDTAVTTVLDAINKLRDTSSSHDRITIVEVMGRKCGDIALYAGLAGGAEAVLIPELPYDVPSLCQKLILGVNAGKQHSIIIKSEGVDISSEALAKELEERTGQETKTVNLSYLQRGGSPTMRDRILATTCAQKAVELIEEESDSKAIGIIDDQIVAFDLKGALDVEREVNRKYYDLIGVLSK